ncbi:hypothetical protein ACWIUD_00150 [Helicobacter sp. 23-1044]
MFATAIFSRIYQYIFHNAKSCDKSWILASHYPSDDFDGKMALALKDKNAKFEKAKSWWGVILGRF